MSGRGISPVDVRGQWYRCSRCGKDAQVSKDGRIKVCCWADKYPIESPRARAEVSPSPYSLDRQERP
jgi:hypothetical protein